RIGGVRDPPPQPPERGSDAQPRGHPPDAAARGVRAAARPADSRSRDRGAGDVRQPRGEGTDLISGQLFASFSMSFFESVWRRESRPFTFRSEAWSARISFFDRVPFAMYATQSSRFGVPRQATVTPLSRIFRRPSTFASGFRLPSIVLAPPR